MVVVINMLINLGEGILVSNCRFVLIYPNFSLLFGLSYIHGVAIVTINLIYNICSVS